MTSHLVRALGAACLLLQSAVPVAAADFKIVTASPRGTYIEIGRNMAEFVAPQAGISLEVLSSAGSSENVRRLRHEPGVKLALVQSDVYQAFLDLAAGGNADARDMIRPLRVILPLYNEEIYFLAREDSSLNTIDDLKDAKINMGERGSGTTLTSTTLYRLLFNGPIPEANATYLKNEEALIKLLSDKSIDAVAVVAGQPAKLLVDMTPEARKHVKLLKFDPTRASSQAALQTYVAATVRATSYPNLLTEDVPALAVKAYLVTYEFSLPATNASLRQFAQSLCQNFAVLQAKGHPKWKEVTMALPDLGRGWLYYEPTASEIRTCMLGNKETPNVVTPKACSPQEQLLGFCKPG